MFLHMIHTTATCPTTTTTSTCIFTSYLSTASCPFIYFGMAATRIRISYSVSVICLLLASVLVIRLLHSYIYCCNYTWQGGAYLTTTAIYSSIVLYYYYYSSTVAYYYSYHWWVNWSTMFIDLLIINIFYFYLITTVLSINWFIYSFY